MRKLIFGFDDKQENKLTGWGLLILRLGVGLNMMLSHGWGKLLRLGDDPIQFADPYGIGQATSLVLAAFAEFFCSIAVVLGFMTRLAVVPLAITMLTALFIIHADDPWQRQEFALMFLIPYLTLFLAGPGRFSIDNLLRSKQEIGARAIAD